MGNSRYVGLMYVLVVLLAPPAAGRALGGLGLDGGAGGHGGARLLGQPLRTRQDVRRRAQHAQRVQHRYTYII